MSGSSNISNQSTSPASGTPFLFPPLVPEPQRAVTGSNTARFSGPTSVGNPSMPLFSSTPLMQNQRLLDPGTFAPIFQIFNFQQQMPHQVGAQPSFPLLGRQIQPLSSSTFSLPTFLPPNLGLESSGSLMSSLSRVPIPQPILPATDPQFFPPLDLPLPSLNVVNPAPPISSNPVLPAGALSSSDRISSSDAAPPSKKRKHGTEITTAQKNAKLSATPVPSLPLQKDSLSPEIFARFYFPGAPVCFSEPGRNNYQARIVSKPCGGNIQISKGKRGTRGRRLITIPVSELSPYLGKRGLKDKTAKIKVLVLNPCLGNRHVLGTLEKAARGSARVSIEGLGNEQPSNLTYSLRVSNATSLVIPYKSEEQLQGLPRDTMTLTCVDDATGKVTSKTFTAYRLLSQVEVLKDDAKEAPSSVEPPENPTT